jgi:arabinofuranosyltransferase
MSSLEEKSNRFLTTNGYQLSSFGNCSDYVIMIWLSLFLYVLVANAWVADDAYITFRTLDNLVNGYGLRWNVTERVQAFTNPLWLFVHVPFYYFTKEVYFTTLLISLCFDTITFLLVAKLFKASPGFVLSFVCIPLILSQAFRDYATSGLETPLTFLFLAIFCTILVHRTRFLATTLLFYTSLIVALSAFNRLDTILFYLPVLTFLSISRFSARTLGALLGGFLPLLLWEVFSLFYYGFLFPNTAYAKLSTGIATRNYVQQGLVYAIDFLKYDSWSVTVILSAALLTMYTFYQLWQHRQQVNSIQFESHLLPALMGSGLLLYCFYILRVGGDFMSGRFWATPFFLAVLLLNWFLQSLDKQLAWRNYVIGIAFVFIFLGIFPKLSDDITIRLSGIADEKKFYLGTNSLLNYTRGTNVAVHPWSIKGSQLKDEADKQGHQSYIAMNQGIGMLGFYAGDKVTIIDPLGLSDPLLARLPVAEDHWRIGHHLRKIPQGYRRVHKTGSLDRLPLSLAQYYQPLHSIITDPLFDWQRLTTILWFNLGKYDHYLEEYIKQNPQDFASFVKTK